MHIVSFDYSTHANMIQGWGEKHKFPLPPKPYLPSVGLVVDDIAAGFLYSTDSGMGLLEWVFANPTKSKEERKEALDLLFHALIGVATNRGILALFSTSNTNAFSAVLARNGFQESDNSVTHFIKILDSRSVA